MFHLINKNLTAILNIFIGIMVLPLFLAIVFVNIENIYQFNFTDIYLSIYLFYLVIGFLFLSFLRFIKIKNNVLREEIIYTLKFILFIGLLIIPSFFIHHYFILEYVGESNLDLRSYGKIAFLYFSLSLIISPILRFIKNTSFRENLILSRKVFGIIAFIFFIKHGLEYFTLEYTYSQYTPEISYLSYVYKNLLLRFDALSGFLAGILMLTLGLTSNKISIKLFSGKGWKRIQSLVYPAFLISIIHVAFASRFDNFYIFLVILVVGIRTLSFFSNKTEKTSGLTNKYICIPCGFIYDENVGDVDSGIKPGTKFNDIPDDWYCPVCGVTKKDFEPYYEDKNTVFGGYLSKVVSYQMLTEDVLELSLKMDVTVDILKGQYAILTFEDFDGEFSRPYSVVKSKNNIITFGIKLKNTGRGARKLKSIQIGDTVKIKGFYGDFILQNTSNPKVFIATGTGLSPIMNIISTDLKGDNKLFFGVKNEKDLFYLDQINSIKNLETNIYLSREEKKGFNYGRVDLSKFNFNMNTEFYICGNPIMVENSIKYLNEKGFKYIYSEKF